MAHFAQINETNIVAQVIVADQEVINTGLFGDPASWIQTSYNTYGGMHKLGGTPLRKNFAGIGYTYDADADVFIAVQPHASWSLDNNFDWQPPTRRPEGVDWYWDEDSLSWLEQSS